MTTNVYSGSTASAGRENDRRDQDDNQSSNEIRADIDQTRASVGEKIDQLQSRLDPNKLKAQAQETIQEMLSDTANSMTDYVRSHKDEMVNSLADAARRNPLPTALVGLGVGWLILESMTGNKRKEDDRWDYERRNLRSRGYEGGRFEGSTGRSFVSQGRGQFMEEDYYSPEYYDEADSGRSGFAGNAEFASRPEDDRRREQHYDQRSGNGHQQGSNPLAKAANAVKDTVSDVSGEIKDRVEDMGQEIKERVSDVKDRMGGAVDDARYQADNMRHRMSDQGNRMSDQGQRQLNRAGYRMEEWQARARYEGQRRGQQVMNNLEDNPLTYGAVALAAGVALALLLPQTRTENRYFGEMRDEMMDRGKEVMESAKGAAQEVVAEVRPELEEKARQLVSDVKEAGKEVAKDAVSELRPVMDKAMEKGKEAATNVAQEVGVDPNKLTGNKPASGASTSSTATSSTATSGASASGTMASGTMASGTMASGTSSSGSSMGGKSDASTGHAGATSMGTGLSAGTGKTSLETPVLNRDTLAGQWKQVKGEVKSKWGQLTDDDLTRAEGNYEKLVGAIQTRYGYARDRAEREVNDWFSSRKSS